MFWLHGGSPWSRVCALTGAGLALCPVTASAQRFELRQDLRIEGPKVPSTPICPIEAPYHIQNETGRLGGGLCSIAAILTNGLAQGVSSLLAGKMSPFWWQAKNQAGAYDPFRLTSHLRVTAPNEKWCYVIDDNIEGIKRFNAAGYPVAATMLTPDRQSHMVSIAHADDQVVGYVDNNDPGFLHWVDTREYARRYLDGGIGWYFVWFSKRQREQHQQQQQIINNGNAEARARPQALSIVGRFAAGLVLVTAIGCKLRGDHRLVEGAS